MVLAQQPEPPILPPGVVVRKDDSGQFEG